MILKNNTIEINDRIYFLKYLIKLNLNHEQRSELTRIFEESLINEINDSIRNDQIRKYDHLEFIVVIHEYFQTDFSYYENEVFSKFYKKVAVKLKGEDLI